MKLLPLARKTMTVLLAASTLLCLGCRTLQVEDAQAALETEVPGLDEGDDVFHLYRNDDALAQADDGERFIFCRLYQPTYNNPFYIGNILRHLIGVVDIYPGTATHAAINFTLDDSFYGLTLPGKKDLKIESCTDVASNPYMKECDEYKSTQTTFALKVTPEEYERAKALVASFDEDSRLKYSSLQNFIIGVHGIRRRFFVPRSRRAFGAWPDSDPDATFETDRHDFVCSSLVAYILANSVDSVGEYFRENRVDVSYVFPSDLAHLPGIIRLFTSTWVDYGKAAEAYVEIYAALAPYYGRTP